MEETGALDGEFDDPHGIAIHNTGLIFVCDYGNNRIQAFQSDDTFVRSSKMGQAWRRKWRISRTNSDFYRAY
jgi:hypothetical protein